MEQQLIARDEATNRDIFPVSTSAFRKINDMRTGCVSRVVEILLRRLPSGLICA